MINIEIGFRFSKKHEINGRKYWKTYEVIGSCFSLEGGSNPEWKAKEDILNLKKYVQIMNLPYPNHNGLNGLYDDMSNSQLSVFWTPLKEIQNDIESDMKLLPKFRKYKIDEQQSKY